MRNAIPVLVLAGTAFGATPLHAGTPRYKLDPAGRTVVSLSNLSDAEGCFPARVKGKVAKRTFDAKGIHLSGLVIEEPNGSRTFINGHDNHGDDAVTMGAVKRGVDTLLRQGRRVEVGYYACGAAGRVLTLDSVRALD